MTRTAMLRRAILASTALVGIVVQAAPAAAQTVTTQSQLESAIATSNANPNNTIIVGQSFDASNIGTAANAALQIRLSNAGSGHTLGISGLNGTGSVNVSGNGGGSILRLTGTNSFRGLSGGLSVIEFDGDAALGNGPITLSSQTFRAMRDVSVTKAITLSGQGATIDTAGHAMAISGVISGGAPLIAYGGGTLLLSGANTYTAATLIVNHTTVHAAAANVISTASAVSLETGTTFNLDNFNQSIGSLSDADRSTTSRVMLGNATLTTGSDGSSTSYYGAVFGTGSIVKTGAGTFTLGGTLTNGGIQSLAGSGDVILTGTLTTAGTAYALSNPGGFVDQGGTRLILNGGTIDARSGGGMEDGVQLNGGRVTINSGTVMAKTSGVFARTGGTVDNFGAITGGAYGIYFGGTGAQSLTVTGGGTYTGTDFVGILAHGVSANLTLGTSGAGLGTITGGTGGIDALSSGGGAIGIVTRGNVTGVNGTGIIASSSGVVTLTATGNVTGGGAGNAGIFVNGANAANSITLGSASASPTVTGSIGLRIAGGGTTSLTNYGTITTGGTGVNAIQIDSGTLVIGEQAGTLTGNIALDSTGSALTVDRTTALALSNAVTGSGTLNQNGTGLTSLTGINSAANGQFTGTVNINAGTLSVNGTLGDTAGAAASVNVMANGTLHGSGTIAGSVNVASGGTVSAGNSPGTLIVAGNYTLASGATSLFELGTPDTVGGPRNDLIQVGGNLALAGTLRLVNAADATSSPVAGTYRLFNYGGSLSGSFDTVSTPTARSATVYTNVPGQVNVQIASAGQQLQYWDGSDSSGVTAGGQGGDGTWNTADTNWAGSPTATIDTPWAANVGIFGGAAGTVTVAGAQNVQGLQFTVDGYRLGGTGTINLTGDPFSTTDQSFVNVDAGVGATIATALTSTGGTIGLNKVGAGTLTLGGTNSYTGATSVTNGTLVLAIGGALVSDVSVAGGATFGNAGTVDARLTNTGTASNTGRITGAVTSSGTLTNAGTIGGLLTVAAGTTTNTGALSGGVTVTGGTVALAAGSIVNGNVANSGTVTAQGQINGSVTNAARASVTLSGALTGVTGFANDGTLSLASHDLALGTLTGTTTTAIVENGGGTDAMLTVGTGDASGSYAGMLQDGTGGGRLLLAKTGAGTLTMTGANTFTGGTAVDAGTLTVTGTLTSDVSVASGATFNNSGTLNARLANAGTVALAAASIVNGNVANSGAITAQGQINGSVTNAARASVTLAGTLTGVTGFANDGTLSLASHDLTLGTLTGTTTTAIVENGGGTDATLTIGTGDASGSYAGILRDGNGGGRLLLAKAGAGTLTLTGAHSFTGGTAVNAGTLAVTGTLASNVSVASGATFDNGGTLNARLANAGIATNIGRITGAVTTSGTFTNSGALNDGITVTGGTTALAAGSIVNGNVANNGAITAQGQINGAVTNAAGASIRLGGALTGITALANDGTLSLASNNFSLAALTGTGTRGVVENGGGTDATLTLGTGNGDIAYAGTLRDGSGGGRLLLVKAGTGTLTVDGAYSFTGGTTVSAGTLNVAGSLASTVTVARGGALTGSGRIGGLILADGASLAPGGVGTVGTLSVSGNVAIAAGSLYRVDVTPAGQTDAIAAAGTANLAGGTVQVTAAAGRYAPRTRYTILSAGKGVTGQFASVSSNLAFLTPSLSYDANAAYLTLARNDLEFRSVAASINQSNIAGAVQGTGTGSRLYDSVAVLSAAQARESFDALSGEIHSSALTAQFAGGYLVREAVLDHLRAAGSASEAPAEALDAGRPLRAGSEAVAHHASALTGGSGSNPVTVWGQTFATFGSIGANGNAARLHQQTGGFIIGADTVVGDNWRLGAAGSYTRTGLDLTRRQSAATIDTGYAAVYAAADYAALRVRLGGAYSWSGLSTNRGVSFAGFDERQKAHYGANLGQIFGEIGYRLGTPRNYAEPFVSGAAMNLARDGFTETRGTAALTSKARDYGVATTTLGVQAQDHLDRLFGGGSTLVLRSTVGYRRAYGDLTPASRFAWNAGGPSFTTYGAPVARDAMVVQAGLGWEIKPLATLSFTYSGQFGSDDTQDHAVKGSFTYRW